MTPQQMDMGLSNDERLQQIEEQREQRKETIIDTVGQLCPRAWVDAATHQSILNLQAEPDSPEALIQEAYHKILTDPYLKPQQPVTQSQLLRATLALSKLRGQAFNLAQWRRRG